MQTYYNLLSALSTRALTRREMEFLVLSSIKLPSLSNLVSAFAIKTSGLFRELGSA